MVAYYNNNVHFASIEYIMKNLNVTFIIIIVSFFQSCSLITDPQSDVNNKIVFVEEINNQYDILVINADGSSPENLTNSSENETSPQYTPDGTKIIYMRNGDIFSMDSDGTNRINLTNNTSFDYDFSISPNSKTIVYLSTLSYNGPESDIYLMNIDGRNQVRITNTQNPKSKPKFFPDGAKIIYTSYDTLNAISSLYSIKLDGTENKLLTPQAESFSDPALSNHSNMICIFGRKALFLMDYSGGEFNKTY